MKTWRLVSGILSIVFFIFIILQSCAAMIVDNLSDGDGLGGATGTIFAFLLLVAGIVSIATRKGSKGGSIALVIIFGFCALIGFTMHGVYEDLIVWSLWCVICGILALIAAAKPVAVKQEETSRSVSTGKTVENIDASIVAPAANAAEPLTVARGTKSSKKPIVSKWWFWVVIAVVCLIVIKNISNTSTQEAVQETGNLVDDTDVKTGAAVLVTDAGGKSNTNTADPVDKTDGVSVEIPEQVIFEGNDVIITAKGIEKSGSGYNVLLLIENNSSLNLGFNAHSYAVNGIMTRNNIYDMDCDVAAGKKANTKLELQGSILRTYGISDIRCIDLLLWAYDNDKHFKEFDTDQIEIKTNLFDGNHDTIAGETSYDHSGIKIDFLSADRNEFDFCITNTTGTYFTFDFENITINDYTVTDIDFDLYDETLLNDSQILCTITVDEEFMRDNSIDSVETIEFNIEYRANGSYMNREKTDTIICSIK